ncbi:DEAD/DEAH box helicase, partial [uncultured Muribaculum sp.]|uniref:DEAD/DEAH box helicase n=1 Tax=uncultured Muribaculum sp. TaxID=1918613 RepID=UPI0026E52580
CYQYRESIKEIEGRFYDADEKCWVIPLTVHNASTLSLLGASLDESLKELAKTARVAFVSRCEHRKPRVKAKLFAHQQDAYVFALDTFEKGKAVALLADMGTGKSMMTIAITGTLEADKGVKKMLVVCPKSIVGVWEDEFRKFADYRYALTVLDGTMEKKRSSFNYMQGAALQIIVVNYESCWRLETEISKWNPDLIVCDESSKIKTPSASQSKALHRLGRQSKYNIILTGTPITGSPLDIFSQYKFLDDSIFGTSFYLFRNRYAILGGYQNRMIVGYRHLDELVEKVHSIAFRIKIEDAVDLPPFIDETRAITLEPKAQSLYRMLEQDCYAELANGEVTARNVLTQLLRLAQCTGGFIRDDIKGEAQQVSGAKLDALEDIIDTCLDEEKKVVVFARFVPEIEAIAAMLKKKKIGYAQIYGATTDRADQVKKFQEDPEIKVFIGQLQTTGMGLTLTAANVAVFYSLDFSYANYEQSRARIHRIGQKQKCLYIHLVGKGTVDEKILNALKHKGDIAKIMVDDWRSLLS